MGGKLLDIRKGSPHERAGDSNEVYSGRVRMKGTDIVLLSREMRDEIEAKGR